VHEQNTAAFLSELIGKTVQPFHVVIDVPERISFESDLFIRDESVSFTESSTVFSRSVVNNFVHSLRKIRIAVHPDFYESIQSVTDISRKLANYLGLHYTDCSDSLTAGGPDERA